MSYVKMLVRAEACTEALAATEGAHRPRLAELEKIIKTHVENTPTSTGKILDIYRLQMFTVMPTVVAPDEEKKKQFVGHDREENFEVTLSIITVGVIFKDCTEEEAAEVMNKLGTADKANTYAGLAWKYFEESDIPRK